MLIKSQVKYIQSLGQKKFRDQEGVFVVEGPKMVKELLAAPNLELLYLIGVAAFRETGIPFIEVKESELERLSSLSTPNQVLAVFRKPVFTAARFDDRVTLVLDGIQDPGNLGTIVRIADWFGISQVVCSSDSADVFSPKATQSTMGSISRVHVMYEEPVALMSGYPRLPVYATVLEGKSVYEQGRVTSGWVVVGNESKGIREQLLQRATHPITIPRIGQAESLNAAVATGIILSHLTAGR
ncbi:MAG: RNA methyltransferase [Chitinophagaceae bacterium]|nr:RNA methyltransferase [Chitinophagaceae bacterium]